MSAVDKTMKPLLEEIGAALFGAGLAAAKAANEGASAEAALMAAEEHLANVRAKTKFSDFREG